MNGAADQIVDLIFGRWRSQILYAGAALGVFDHLATGEVKNAETLAEELGVNSGLLYRLLRALASLGLLVESNSRSFSISKAGELLRTDHPQSLRYMAVATHLSPTSTKSARLSLYSPAARSRSPRNRTAWPVRRSVYAIH